MQLLPFCDRLLSSGPWQNIFRTIRSPGSAYAKLEQGPRCYYRSWRAALGSVPGVGSQVPPSNSYNSNVDPVPTSHMHSQEIECTSFQPPRLLGPELRSRSQNGRSCMIGHRSNLSLWGTCMRHLDQVKIPCLPTPGTEPSAALQLL
jgi:hypothetical protein